MRVPEAVLWEVRWREERITDLRRDNDEIRAENGRLRDAANACLATHEDIGCSCSGCARLRRATIPAPPRAQLQPPAPAAPQPPPSGDGPEILPMVMEDLRIRAAAGLAKYGTPLRAFNGRDALVALVGAYQEELDKVMYLRQAICEAETEEDALANSNLGLRAELERIGDVLDEFGPQHTGKTISESVDEALTTLRGRIAKLLLGVVPGIRAGVAGVPAAPVQGERVGAPPGPGARPASGAVLRDWARDSGSPADAASPPHRPPW